MGRKLTAIEEVQAIDADRDAERQGGQAQLRQRLLERIADQLGITVEQFDQPRAFSIAVQPATDPERQGGFDLPQQCVDLVEAFIRIRDPQDRLRCLQIIRDATGVKS